MIDDAASIRSWVQKAIQQTLAFLAGKTLGITGLGCSMTRLRVFGWISPYAGGVYPALADSCGACMFADLNLGWWVRTGQIHQTTSTASAAPQSCYS